MSQILQIYQIPETKTQALLVNSNILSNLISGVLYAEFSVWVESIAEIRACVYKRSYLIHSRLIWICLSSVQTELLSSYN